MKDKEILDNAPVGATHIAFSNYRKEIKYLQTDTDVINNWFHWVGETRHYVDYDFTVVYDHIRSLSGMKEILELKNKLEEFNNE